MTIELHTWNTPNGRKISVALEEMGLPYKVFPVNITKGEQIAPACLAISPNNKIPAIVDPDGPGGKRVSIFESGAILLYLGERTGKFLPAPLIERIPVLEWLMWQMGGFGPMPGQVHHFIALENETDRAYGLKRYMTETRRLYGVLDRRLATREFVADAFRVSDVKVPFKSPGLYPKAQENEGARRATRRTEVLGFELRDNGPVVSNNHQAEALHWRLRLRDRQIPGVEIHELRQLRRGHSALVG